LTTKGEPTYDLIRKLSAEGAQLNITAIYTDDQVEDIVDALNPEVDSYVSIFAGRLSDAGNDPVPTVRHAVEITKDRPLTEILWASTREVYNIIQADQFGVDIITVPNNILEKWAKRGRAPHDLSLDTVRGFAADIATLGFSILPDQNVR
jgi:transaldolase